MVYDVAIEFGADVIVIESLFYYRVWWTKKTR